MNTFNPDPSGTDLGPFGGSVAEVLTGLRTRLQGNSGALGAAVFTVYM